MEGTQPPAASPGSSAAARALAASPPRASTVSGPAPAHAAPSARTVSATGGGASVLPSPTPGPSSADVAAAAGADAVVTDGDADAAPNAWRAACAARPNSSGGEAAAKWSCRGNAFSVRASAASAAVLKAAFFLPARFLSAKMTRSGGAYVRNEGTSFCLQPGLVRNI